MKCSPLLAALLALVLATACAPRSSPEQQVRAAIAAAEAAAEARDLSDVMALVSEEYADDAGRDREQVRNFMRGWLVLNQSVNLLTRIESLEFPAERLARVRVRVGMLGRRGAAEDWSLAAELHEIEAELVLEGGEWRVRRARLAPRSGL